MVDFLSQEWLDLHLSLGSDLPARAGATGVLQFVVEGAPEGAVSYVVAIADGRLAAATLGRNESAEVTFTESFKDASAIARGELDLHVGFMQGRVKFAGSMGSLMAVLPVTQSQPYRALVAAVAAETSGS